MGEPRFVYGFLKGLLSNKSCPVRVELLNVQQDKGSLLSSWKAGECKGQDGKAEVWTEFERPWLYFAYVVYSSDLIPLIRASAGKLPYVARSAAVILVYTKRF